MNIISTFVKYNSAQRVCNSLPTYKVCFRFFCFLWVLWLGLVNTHAQSQSKLGTGPSSRHSSAVSADGKTYTWGFNDNMQLGNGTNINASEPQNISSMGALKGKTIISIANGTSHTIALASDNTVYVWGHGEHGQLGLGIGKTAGSAYPMKVEGLTGVTAIAAGAHHSLALGADGKVYAWGSGSYGQLGNGSTGNSSIPVPVKDPSGTGDLTGVTDIAAGGFHSLAIGADGKVFSWGHGIYGQLGNGSTGISSIPVPVKDPSGTGDLTGVTDIAGGNIHSLGIGAGGKVYAWGWAQFGALGNNAPGSYAVSVPVLVKNEMGTEDLVGVKAIAAGHMFSLAIGADDLAYSWGYGSLGQLGIGNLQSSSIPKLIASLTGVKTIAASYYHALALGEGNQVYAWGDGQYGVLGSGSTQKSLAPVPVTFCAPPTPTFTSEPELLLCLNSEVTYTTQTGHTNYDWVVPGTAGTDYNITSGGIDNASNTVTLKWLTSGEKTVNVNYAISAGCSGVSAASSTTTVGTLADVAITGPSTAPISTSTTSTSSYSMTGVTITSWKVTFGTTDDNGESVEELYSESTGAVGESFTITWPSENPRVFKLYVVYTNGYCTKTATMYVSVYDPSSGFVTGGGAVYSPAGALVGKHDAVGEAKFGLVSKFDKTGKVTGSTDFEFLAGDFYFKSILHNDGSLVIDNTRATYRGEGYLKDPITGAKMNDVVYKFMVSAYDPQVTGSTAKDRFRIKISNKATEAVIYDNLLGADENVDLTSADFASIELISGSIVIHKPLKSGSTAKALISEARQGLEPSANQLHNYPNPYSARTTISFSTQHEESFTLEVYDLKGALVKRIASGNAEPGKLYEYEFNPGNMADGIYLARLTTNSKVQSHKMVVRK